MKLALVVPPGPRDPTGALARRLERSEHDVRLVDPDPGRLGAAIERRLHRRNYVEGLARAPRVFLDLQRGSDDLVHAFHPVDAEAGVRASRRVVFEYPGVPDHADLMTRRKKLEVTVDAARGAAAVVAHSAEAAAAFDRWLGVEARVIAPDAADEYLALYTELAS